MESAGTSAGANNRFLKAVLFGSFGLGMAVPWLCTLCGGSIRFRRVSYSLFSALALFGLPSLRSLSFAAGPAPDSGLALGLVVGTIVFANGFLYAGVAAGIYAAMVALLRRESRR